MHKITILTKTTMFGELGISQNMFMLPLEFFTAVAFELNNMLCVS